MTDREMLELAASAAGYVFGEYGGKPARQVTTKIGAARIYWNPLTDDGADCRGSDHYRLGVSTRLSALH
jgi:hypothetical protein